MIKKLVIENFRSIKYLDIDLLNLNPIIGANSVGKSNILKALNIILGPTYPSARSFDECDFFQRKSVEISIKVYFENPLRSNSSIAGFILTYDETTFQYCAIDSYGEILYNAYMTPVRVSNEMRAEVTLLYISLDRLAHHQIKSSNWTLYGKLIEEIQKKISFADKKSFLSDVKGSYSAHIESYLLDVQQDVNLHVKEQTGLNIDFEFFPFEPTKILKDVRPRIYSQSMPSFKVDISEEGGGVQSAFCIAIARSYAKFFNSKLILSIEEPELFLHPHACRHLYKLLKELSSQGVQILYTSHERCFVNIADYQNIKIVSKQDGSTKSNAFDGTVQDFELIKAASKFNEQVNEVFFAEKVVLVEGANDRMGVLFAFEALG